MDKPALQDLSAFLAVATRRSFRKAAEDLGVTPSALTRTLRHLEAQMGVRLLNRTTRSVSPTEAGERLAERLVPLLGALDAVLDDVAESRGEPAGTLRINAGEIAARLLLEDVVPAFLERSPRMALDLVTDGRFVDIVAEGFDAGVRLGEAVPQDMIAVHFGGDARFLAYAAPSYLDGRGVPSTPDDLARHECIRLRMPSGKPYRWEFARGGEVLTVDVPGRLTLDHPGLVLECAARGMGIAYASTRVAGPLVAAGALRPLLEDWCPVIPGLFLYYPGHRHVRAGLKTFIEVLRERLP